VAGRQGLQSTTSSKCLLEHDFPPCAELGLFDTVVSTLGTCTFLDPVEALCEMRRVCRPGGRILLLEHGRSDRPGIAEWQDRRAPKHAACLGCWWNREPLENVRKAGLKPHTATRGLLGMVHIIDVSV